MSAIFKAISYLVKFEYEKGKVIETLEQIVEHMVKVNEEAKVLKTFGNALTIVGTVAAPFTFGLSLFGTASGIVLNVATSVTENRLMSSLLGKVQEVTSELQDLAEKIKVLDIDWSDVAITLCKSVMDVGFTQAIFKEISKDIPHGLFLQILITLKDKVVLYCCNTVFISNLSNATDCAIKILTKEISTECVEQAGKSIGKNVGKRIIFTSVLVGAGVFVDVVDIIRIWKAGDPEPVKQVRKIIEDLKAD